MKNSTFNQEQVNAFIQEKAAEIARHTSHGLKGKAGQIVAVVYESQAGKEKPILTIGYHDQFELPTIGETEYYEGNDPIPDIFRTPLTFVF